MTRLLAIAAVLGLAGCATSERMEDARMSLQPGDARESVTVSLGAPTDRQFNGFSPALGPGVGGSGQGAASGAAAPAASAASGFSFSGLIVKLGLLGGSRGRAGQAFAATLSLAGLAGLSGVGIVGLALGNAEPGDNMGGYNPGSAERGTRNTGLPGAEDSFGGARTIAQSN